MSSWTAGNAWRTCSMRWLDALSDIDFTALKALVQGSAFLEKGSYHKNGGDYTDGDDHHQGGQCRQGGPVFPQF